MTDCLHTDHTNIFIVRLKHFYSFLLELTVYVLRERGEHVLQMIACEKKSLNT